MNALHPFHLVQPCAQRCRIRDGHAKLVSPPAILAGSRRFVVCAYADCLLELALVQEKYDADNTMKMTDEFKKAVAQEKMGAVKLEEYRPE